MLLSPDGSKLAGPSTNGALGIWDLRVPGVVASLPFAGGPVIPVAWSPDSTRLVTREFMDGTTREWDVVTGKALRTWETAGGPFLRPLDVYSPEGQWFLAASGDGVGELWDRRSGQGSVVNLGLKQLTQASFSPAGNVLAAVSRSGEGGLWSLPGMTRLATLRGFLQGMGSVGYSPDGTRLAIGGDGLEAVKLWDTASLRELLTLAGEGSTFYSVAFSPNGEYLGSSNGRGVLQLWHAPSWEQIHRQEASAR